MKKRVIIISIVMIIALLAVILISYVITKNSNGSNDANDTTQEKQAYKDVNKIDTIDKNVYTDINIDSALAQEIFGFAPKYLQNNVDKMSNEYIIYAAMCRLEDQKVETSNYKVGETEFQGYKSDLVIEAAKRIYGENIKITKDEKYNLPIGYSSDNDAFYKYPMGFGSAEEFQVIKELKENDKIFKLTIYALNIEYDVNDFNHIYIETKDTFKLYRSQMSDEDTIRKSMKEYTISGIELDPTSIASVYKNDLPLIEYELEKLDDRGTKYFIKNVKLILD